ncbi:MAG: ribosome maturation factor RimP [Rhodothalassiaceae bacterium]|nr:MAG: ribosome maturation factor RimP [Rhodothalassiaceae bacterium]
MDEHETPLRDEDRLGAAQETPLIARLYDIVEPVVERLGFRLVRILLMGGAGRVKLQVMAERAEGGLSVDDCVLISRELDPVLDVADPIAESYVLEVSSPGIDRPLTRVGDFARFAGERAAVEVDAPVDGRRRVRGRLVGREGEELLIAGEAGELTRLPIRRITKAKLLASDDLFAGPGRRPRGSNGRGRSGT